MLTELAAQHNIEALMTDLSAASIELARQRGVSCYHGSITDAYFDQYQGSADVIVALEVIEHVYSPMVFLSRIYKLLRPGGLFVFTTGNVNETRIRGKSWGYMNIPEAHIYYFSTKSMNSYLKKTGFSGRVDAYRYYSKKNIAVRVMERYSLIDLTRSIKPTGACAKAAYSAFKAIETISGRRRFDWAVK